METLIKEGKNSFENLIELNHNIINREYAKFRYKFNKLYLNKRLARYLDSGEIDISILNVTNQWAYLINKDDKNCELRIRKYFPDHIYFSLDITKAFLEENLILHHRYNSRVYPYQRIYNRFFLNESKQLNQKFFSGFSLHYYLKYLYYYIFKHFNMFILF